MERKNRQAIFDIENALTYRISQLFTRLSTGTTQDLAAFGLVLREWRVMAMLARHEPLSASELVARSPLDKASVSRAIASLEQRDLVSVAPSTEDARVKVLHLTNAGWTLYGKIAPRSVARQKALMAVLTVSERASLMSMLDRLEKAIVVHIERSKLDLDL